MKQAAKTDQNRKRWRKPKAKQGELRVCYGVSERGESPDICYVWGEGTKGADAKLLHCMLSGYGFRIHGNPPAPNDGFIEELKARGYDLTTLKFSIQKLPEATTGTER